ncbi:(Fe-S)-binding protein [Limisalsivibrio acetivorans]|uniref:(Fe-S)-binding protein n=1 Tax=Limisalsivibrio acetivorans TaxID=1304888 RepID=UPI0003B76624|nr:(Fe-S)-binding protein [Limisalsivibrio acetivorans]
MYDDVVKELKELEELVLKCMKCGTCHADCPLYNQDGKEQSVARGKIALIQSVYEGRLEDAGKILKHIDYCVLCGRCKQSCPSGVKTDEIFLKAKSVLRKIEKMKGWQKFVLSIAMEKPELLAKMAPLMHMGLKFGSKKIKDDVFKPIIPIAGGRNVVSVKSKTFADTYGGLNKAKGEEKMTVIFYPGCAANMIYTSWGEAIVETLNYFGVSVYVPEVNHCCGIPAATMGELDLFKKMVNKNIDYFDSLDAKYIVTCCPTCQYGLNEMGPKQTGRSPEQEMMDVVVFLEEVLHADIKLETGEKTTIHFPCHYDRSKDSLLESFVKDNLGTDYTKLKNQSCCGFGGTFSLKHYGKSSDISTSKAEEISTKGFQRVYTPCPGCAMQLTDALAKEGSEADVSHPVQLFYESVVKKS